MRRLAGLLLVAGWLAVFAVPARAADSGIVDDANVLSDPYYESLRAVVDAWNQLVDGRLLVVTRIVDSPESAAAEAEALRRLPGLGGNADLVLVIDVAPGGCSGVAGLAMSADISSLAVRPDEAAFAEHELADWLGRCQVGPGASVATSRLLAFALTDAPLPTVEPGQPGASGGPAATAAGPPFPPPIDGQAVYDRAGVFRPDTIARAEQTIDAIEARTGAEVVVYSQVVDYGITTEEADGHAQALMDQWGVGRKGFDDGLVILFDLDPSLVHGQVQLYGGPGYRAAFLDNAEKQRIFDEDMVPRLRAEDLDGALLVALERVDDNATPEHAGKLQTARQIDAAVGLIGAPIVLIGLVGSALFAWLRYGRDPVYLDDPSIHMAGPPRDLTPAAAAFVVAGDSSRRALTTAMLDLASRGLIAFREEKEMLGLKRKIGIQFDPPAGDAATEAQRARNASRELGPAEEVAQARLRTLAGGEGGYIDPEELLKFGSSVDEFDEALETHAVKMGWFLEKPSKADARWSTRGVIAIVLGVIAFVGALNLPSAGLTLIAGALVIGGIAMLVMSRWMDAVTMPGAMIRAMLAAYRRTLEKTMAQSRSMDQVVAKAGLDWLETPDQAVVWGTALGLERQIEDVLERSLDDVKDGRAVAGSIYVPAWYGTSGSAGVANVGGGGGLFSSSAMPDLGGMMSALGTIGNSPPSSSSGGGGGFSGGSSGGGGGGSGGGF